MRTVARAFLLTLGLTALPCTAAPKAVLWERWTAHDPSATATVDHTAWDRFLRTYLVRGTDGINRVAYSKVTPPDRSALEAYLQRLQATPISRYRREEQRAFWINLYNALTVKTVLDHYPVASILDIRISPGLFSIGPWGKKLVKVEGEDLSLDDMEHRILRPIWRDPRVHYAVNCASLGCPNLMPVAFAAGNAEALLDKGAHDYVNQPRGARLRDGRLIVSDIYKWYQEDFGGSEAGVIAHLARYADPPLRTALAGRSGIDGYEYDWALNDAR